MPGCWDCGPGLSTWVQAPALLVLCDQGQPLGKPLWSPEHRATCAPRAYQICLAPVGKGLFLGEGRSEVVF